MIIFHFQTHIFFLWERYINIFDYGIYYILEDGTQCFKVFAPSWHFICPFTAFWRLQLLNGILGINYFWFTNWLCVKWVIFRNFNLSLLTLIAFTSEVIERMSKSHQIPSVSSLIINSRAREITVSLVREYSECTMIWTSKTSFITKPPNVSTPTGNLMMLHVPEYLRQLGPWIQ